MTTGIIAYDLKPPAKSLDHLITRTAERTEVELNEGAVLRRTYRAACAGGCCAEGTVYQLVVPCDQMPHCHSCECGSEHYIYLSAEHLGAIKGMLP